ncbi:MAG: EAL domain-containing protein [Gemmatimonadaceae bacterium]|nr:EAL domain-containing protein [Gloeobacterales cyanobacterium ES-bin-141]
MEQERRGREQLAWQANHDSLTKLLNRHAFEQHLAVAVKSAHLHGYRHALCFLDIDQFRIVNDICGHRAGDELLRQITALLIAHLQASDTLARLGGDEFGLLLFECSPESARQFIEHLLERMSRFRFSWEGNNFTIGASVGVVAIDRAHMLDNLLSAANVACAQAKNTGRNRVCIWQPDDEQLQQQRGYMQWVTRIHRALEDNTFCLYTQKIVPTTGPQTGEHYEVLIRLRDEQGKIIAPMAFIPAAERYNLMGQIDRWVIETLFAGQAEHYRRNWEQVREGGPECLYCVNLSGASINDERFVHFVTGQFEQHRVPPQLICFEITETQAIANLSRASELIHALKDLGCHFALDDFGSGTSSFDYLKNLPVDYLKIDGAFIKNIVEDPVDRTIVASITNVAKLMGVRTIAEFVENQAILDLVCELGIDYAQGYGIARPEPIGG